MTSLLYGQLRSRVTCVVCGLQSTTFDPYNNLQLDIPPSQASCSLDELLDNYFREQDMSAEERFMCPRCGCKQLCRKKLDLWSVPQYLIIQLKRFEMFLSVAGFTQRSD